MEDKRMAISAKLVKELREKTGAGMMDCKKALEACDGNLEASFDWLREKGIAKAAKKADRIAAEGLTAFVIDGNAASIVEVNSETDFVAKNAEFQELVADIAKVIVANQPADLDAALKLQLDGKDLETVIAEKSGKIGEKLSLRRFAVLTKEDAEVFGAYSHMGGKMSALVKLSDSDEEKAKDIAMHVAASAPQYIDRTAIPTEVLDRELTVLKAQAMEENATSAKPKPENIIEKMVEGRLNKNLKEMCLVDQEFIKDPDQTVAKYLGNGKVLEMVRFQVGEGMEKREENFAEEVAAQMKG
jgi:elongation factor Ts